jgi:hypothetical protein
VSPPCWPRHGNSAVANRIGKLKRPHKTARPQTPVDGLDVEVETSRPKSTPYGCHAECITESQCSCVVVAREVLAPIAPNKRMSNMLTHRVAYVSVVERGIQKQLAPETHIDVIVPSGDPCCLTLLRRKSIRTQTAWSVKIMQMAKANQRGHEGPGTNESSPFEGRLENESNDGR